MALRHCIHPLQIAHDQDTRRSGEKPASLTVISNPLRSLLTLDILILILIPLLLPDFDYAIHTSRYKMTPAEH
jgi:hypothetical protein